MDQYLVFTLSSALAAMGEYAGHERRGTLSWPGRSAIIGLLGAALGIRRDDSKRFEAFNALKIAVGVFEEGQPLRDYHTIETIPTAKAKRPNSRLEALTIAGRNETNTTITLRDYRVGVLYGVAIWGADLSDFVSALKNPYFTLYMGRKSCPLAAPTAPCIVEASDALQALGYIQKPPFMSDAHLQYLIAEDAFDARDIQQKRNDIPIDRQKWHFRSRNVFRHNVHI